MTLSIAAFAPYFGVRINGLDTAATIYPDTADTLHRIPVDDDVPIIAARLQPLKLTP
jgi:hypothetical protein